MLASRTSIRSATSGTSRTRCQKAAGGSDATSVLSTAITSAERGLPSIPATSPKQSPGPMSRKVTWRAAGRVRRDADASGDDEVKVAVVCLARDDLLFGRVAARSALARKRFEAIRGQAVEQRDASEAEARRLMVSWH